MLGFFRRIINSKLGLIVTFVLLGAAALAFAASDVTGLRTTGMGGLTGNDVAKVGKGDVTVAQLRSRAQNDMEGFRQQQPTLDMATYLNGGGLDGSLARLITSLAFTEFGASQGMTVSRRTVDGQIASIPGLQGATGQFSPQIYQQLLAQRHLTDQGIRQDIARDTMAQQLVQPISGATQMPMQLALPYASLMLEKRSGSIGFVPTKAMPAGPAPTDAEIATFYQRSVARYGLPPRRVIRYAVVTPDQAKAQSIPTDAEIAAAYKTQGARFAAAERRTIQQVVVLDEAGAAAIAAKVKGGQSIADAAKAAGLEASTRTDVDKPAYASTGSPAVADAVFAAAKGAVVGPIRGPLGFTIAQVQSIDQVAAKSLDQAKAILVPELTKQKTQVALAGIHDGIDDALAKNATFDEVVADHKLVPTTTPALTAAGIDPSQPTAKLDPNLRPILAAGFAAQDGDAPQMVPIGTDGGFAVVALGKALPAAPRPLADVRQAVIADLTADRARQAARRMAIAIVAAANKGTPIGKAIGDSGAKLPTPRPITASRAQITANPQAVPPPLALMFSMTANSTKMLEAPNGAGYFLVRLDQIVPGNATGNAAVIAATQRDLGHGVGGEYVEQFIKAVRAQIGVKTDPGAIAKVRADLLGQTNSGN